jgi:hypothetical protein
MGAASALAAEPLRFSSGPGQVALIELYTSEGCSSCPPADQWLGALRDDPRLWRDFVPVAFHVSYWDSLGWKDRLSSQALTQRQYAYASSWGNGRVYTPCFVRNGAEWRPLWGGFTSGGGRPGLLTVEVADGGRCRVLFHNEGGAGALTGHVAVLGGGLSSRVTAGENSGSTLRHEFVVLGLSEAPLAPFGAAGAVAADLDLPAPQVRDAPRHALAAWVTRGASPAPLQATGGWLP